MPRLSTTFETIFVLFCIYTALPTSRTATPSAKDVRVLYGSFVSFFYTFFMKFSEIVSVVIRNSRLNFGGDPDLRSRCAKQFKVIR